MAAIETLHFFHVPETDFIGALRDPEEGDVWEFSRQLGEEDAEAAVRGFMRGLVEWCSRRKVDQVHLIFPVIEEAPEPFGAVWDLLTNQLGLKFEPEVDMTVRIFSAEEMRELVA